MPLLFAITLFLSASLLFLVQPMIAKMILPSLGGTPAVWNTCMVFFQAALLAGYAYAHASTSWLVTRRQVLVHAILLFLPFLVFLAFPISMARGWVPRPDANPIPQLLTLLLVSVGLPFIVLSTSAPLLQKWFARTGHASAKDPYYLYAASNLGSMLALNAYPTVVEPNLTLNPEKWLSQSWLWTAGYGLFVLFMLVCARVVWRYRNPETETSRQADKQMEEREAIGSVSLSAWQRLRWVALAFVPSSLMLGATTYITLDIAAIPLLWIIPLDLYLLSFILVFAKWPRVLHRVMVTVLPLVLLVLVFRMVYADKKWPIIATMGLHLLALFFVALVCHGELAKTRPSPRYLTQFYLLLSLGGVLGGLFNALLAPVIFNSAVEYKVALVLACLLLPPADWEAKVWLARFFPDRLAKPVGVLADVILAAALGLIAYFLFRFFLTTPGEDTWRAVLRDGVAPAIDWIKDHFHVNLLRMEKALIFGLVTLLCYSYVMRPIRFGLAVGAFMLVSAYYDKPGPDEVQLLCQKRSFFGVLKVQYYPGEEAYTLTHGTTLHGQQIRKPGEKSEPLTYYHTSGPIGQVFTEFSGPRAKRNVALIGLGSGTLASYGEHGQHLTFYDIDPAVRDIATNENYFTYLRDCRASLEIILGDARLKLREADDKKYGIIVVDAFSSDAIPIHLITREALELYFRKLAADGVLAVHISNRHLDLQPVLGNLARELGLVGLRQYDSEAESRSIPGISRSDWVVLARQREDLGSLGEDERWKLIETDPKVGVWTDDFSNLLSVFMWKN